MKSLIKNLLVSTNHKFSFLRNFIDEECENHTVVIDVGEITRNINQKKKPDTFL